MRSSHLDFKGGKDRTVNVSHRNPDIRATGIGHLSMHHESLQNSELQNLDGSSGKGWSDLRKYLPETSRTAGITGTESSGKLSLGPKLAWF